MIFSRFSTSVCVCALLGIGALLCKAQEAEEAMQGDFRLSSMPVEEQHMRSGIMLLAALYETLAKVKDHDSAQAAVPEISRISRDLHSWAQGVSALPPLGEKEMRTYERHYLPTIRRVNDHLRAQGERLAASEYFGSQDLASALITLYSMAQQ